MRRLGLGWRMIAALALLGGAPAALQAAKVDVQACDRLAANPRDPQRLPGAAGVDYDDIDTARAIPACEAAMAAFPLEPRFQGMLSALYFSKGNYEAALLFSRPAALAGNVVAMDVLGSLHIYGYAPNADPREGRSWLEKASAAGFSESFYVLGYMNEFAVGVEKNVETARSLYRRSAEAGFAHAYKALGDSLSAETGNRGADLGNAAAMEALARMYFNGVGVAQSDSEAVRYYLLAAEAGDAAGMYSIGVMYDTARGVAEDVNAAFSWFSKSAERGYADGMVSLAWAYYNGRGTAVDKNVAFGWHSKAAALGNGAGLYGLSLMQHEGAGTAQNSKAAAGSMMQALALNDVSAQREFAAKFKDWKPNFRESVQQLLKAEGFYSGPISGVIDAATVAAAEAYAAAKQRR
jgi:uncharacterized protein